MLTISFFFFKFKGSPVTLPGWVHITGVFNSAIGQMLIYVNGALSATTTLPVGVTPSEDSSHVILGSNLDGYIDELYFYTSALSSTQVMTAPLCDSANHTINRYRTSIIKSPQPPFLS